MSFELTGLQGTQGNHLVDAVAVLAQAYFMVLVVVWRFSCVVRFGLDVEAAAFTPV